MADIIDIASDNEYSILASQIANSRKSVLPPSTGKCFECDDTVEKGRRFCIPDPDYGSCEETYNKRKKNMIGKY